MKPMKAKKETKFENTIKYIKKIRKVLAVFMTVVMVCMTKTDAFAIEADGNVFLKGFDKRPNYVLYVNTAHNCVTVCELDKDGNEKPIIAMACSSGKEGHETPLGTFSTSDYYDWRLMVDNTYGQYAVRFNGKILFHSVPYLQRSPDTLEWDQYNLLGQSASLGCIRLKCDDVKWIYDNCKVGTRVIVYQDPESPGPLGKPELTKISGEDPRRNWDPTDPHPSNPWRNQ